MSALLGAGAVLVWNDVADEAFGGIDVALVIELLGHAADNGLVLRGRHYRYRIHTFLLGFHSPLVVLSWSYYTTDVCTAAVTLCYDLRCQKRYQK